MTTVSDEADKWITQYTGTNQSYTTTTPLGRISRTTLNNLDQVTTLKYGNFLPLTFTYDGFGRPVALTQGTRTQQIIYNAQGFVAEVRNPLSQATKYIYNADGEVVSQTLPDGRQILFTYDAGGNLASVKPPSKPVHGFLYNLLELVGRYAPPLLGTVGTPTTYEYNRDKQLTRIRRPNGSQVNFNYDLVTGLLKSTVAPDGTYSRSYNSENQLESLSSPDAVSYDWVYESKLTMQQKVSAPGFSAQLNYGYEKFMPKSEQLLAGGAQSNVEFTYDRDKLLVGAGALKITRDLVSGLVSSTQLGRVKETFTYSQFGETASYTALYNGAQIFKEVYTRDLNGRITQKAVTFNAVTTTYRYAYDLAGRLTAASTNGTLSRKYTYDSNSNRLTKVAGATTTSATYDAQDRMLTYGARKYFYTANGDLIRRETGDNKLEYAYNALGALDALKVTSVNTTTGASTITPYNYINDGFGRRIERRRSGAVEERYVYDSAGRLIGELNNTTGSIYTRYVYATRSHVPDYLIRGGVTFKIIHDQVGSVRLIVNVATGEIVSRLDYDEFGMITSSVAPTFQPLAFAGGIRDSVTGLVRFGARDYDPETGRWTSKDPILFKGGDTNLFGYVLNDPINFIDPLGLWSVSGSFYAGFGGGASIGWTADNGFFGGIRVGWGFGAGVSWDPEGASPDRGGPTSGPSIGCFAEAGANAGPAGVNLSTSSGYSNTTGPYYNRPNYSFGASPTIRFGVGVSGGIEYNFHSNRLW